MDWKRRYCSNVTQKSYRQLDQFEAELKAVDMYGNFFAADPRRTTMRDGFGDDSPMSDPGAQTQYRCFQRGGKRI